MAAPVMMPKQGQSVETCIINEWMKKKGDKVAKGDVLFSYETDKASFEYEAEEEGTLIEIFFEEGDEVPVLTNVAVIGDEGESTDEFRPDGKQDNEPEEEEKTKQPQKATKEEVEVTRKAEETGEAVKISPRAKKMAEQLGVYYQNIAG